MNALRTNDNSRQPVKRSDDYDDRDCGGMAYTGPHKETAMASGYDLGLV